ncbi:MAG TPA: ABC transporter permease subunit [Intrasporangium sp.]|uniref:ABC transporter permease subunit n=1 Tax=Intrasporangium sp. TaxID=1925024 RepID=UPI002D76AA55|nr:ABC transporter permease subunit [Intrasporangium sp.]HET7397706.1 ABC transporter permease subunit [Intrasporangium sp.]
MSVAHDHLVERVERHGVAPPVWWLVFRREFIDLWTGGRVLLLLILFSVVMSVTSALRQIESELSLIPPVEMAFLTILSGISFGLFVGMVIGADSISGERERATLEPLLLTPARPRQIVFGKFLAAMSPWPVTFLLTVPYVVVLARGDDSLQQGLLLGALLGGLLAMAFTGFGMLVSIWAKSNRASLFASLVVYLVFLIPTQWPGSAQKGDLGYLIQQFNPLQASSEFLEKVLVNNRTVAEKMPYLMAAIFSAVGILAVVFLYAAPRLRLDAEAGPPRSAAWGRVAGVLLILGATAALVSVPAPRAQAMTTASGQGLQISTDLGYKTVNASDEVEFNTVVMNAGSEESPPLNVAMNIVKTGQGDPVDPEDWSPERTQQVDPLAPGESSEQTWTVEAILEGDYMVYLTVLPKPSGPNATTQPVSSPGIHLTVKAFAKSNPGGVLPVAIGTPVALMLIALVPRLRRRKAKDEAADGEF